MIDWDKITDEEMRQEVLRLLVSRRDDASERAVLNERFAEREAWSDEEKASVLRTASKCRRRAAHYQQAIDLLTAAPMPGEAQR